MACYQVSKNGSTRLLAMTLYIWLLLLECVIALPHDTGKDEKGELTPVLTTLSREPDLTVFYDLFKSTGGSSGIPGPGFQERFDNPSTGVRYTVFAPTNSALQHLTPAVIANLKRSSSFEYLATILRNHIALGKLSPADLGANEEVRLVGGFSVRFNSSFGMESNPGVTNTDVPSYGQANLIKDSSGQPVQLQASNGVVYKIDNLLNGLATFYGVDAPVETSELPKPERESGTMADVLKSNPELFELNGIFEDLEPDFIDRLDLYSHKPGAEQKTVYLAPGKTAMDVLPGAALEKATQPSNYGASRFLLTYGLGEYDEPSSIVKSTSGFNISIKQGRANNARIEKRVCAENGCVWLVGRWIDPIFV